MTVYTYQDIYCGFDIALLAFFSYSQVYQFLIEYEGFLTEC